MRDWIIGVTAALAVISVSSCTPDVAFAQAACHTPDQLDQFYGQDDWGADIYDGGQGQTVITKVLEPILGSAPAGPPGLMVVGFDPKRGVDFFFYDARACGYLHAGPFDPAKILAEWPDGIDLPMSIQIPKPGYGI